MIQAVAGAYAMGELGRSASSLGGKGGPAPAFADVRDIVSLGNGQPAGAGLYTSRSLFKIIGAVELVSSDVEVDDEALPFGRRPILL